MPIILPESARSRKRAIGGTFVSTVLHVAIIGSTIAATGWTAEAPDIRIDDAPPTPVYVTPPPSKKPPPHRSGGTTVQPTDGLTPDVPPTPSLDFDIPDGVPPVEVRIGTSSVDLFARMSMAHGDQMSTGRNFGSDTPRTSATVDRVVMLLPGNAPPRYPSILASAGVEGEVVMQYVVDTLGRVERTSVRAIEGGGTEFERAVRDALARMTFVPAEAGGRKVRQLVEQTFAFALSRR